MDIDTANPGVYPYPPTNPPADERPDRTSNAVALHDGPITTTDADGTTTDTTGRIFLDVRDELTVRWELDNFDGWGTISLTLQRPDIGQVTFPAQVTRSDGRGYLDTVQHTHPAGGELQKITAHWFNLPAILPADPLQDGSLTYAGRWIFENSGWRLTLDQRRDHKQAVAQAHDSGHAAMTHTSTLERVVGTFTAEHGANVLHALETALSFALGRWVAAALPVGYDRHSQRTWEEWANPRCSRYENGFHWWNTTRSDDLHAMCSAFLDHWLNPNQQPVLRHTVMHAISASSDRTTTEAQVMLAQAGFEYLAWVTNVLEGDTSARQYQKMAAGKKLDEMLKAARIASAIPDEFVGLQSIAEELAQTDPTTPNTGPYALAWLRNRLVHPKNATEPYEAKDAVWNAWLLSVQYLELLILHRLGYGGHYLPRTPNIWATDSQPVPWTQQP